ncbi:fat-like cadherin-related tumor suppressor [Trichonephila clavata]|uniref:Fat-like cadherin-related tumor suppressor n=1 Tax=Trichonephila clavata TaxID=2740835 RepID=A0A8X6KND6_TRICU|nr:fat-like cadherin-related tumor suppressor [Trichonephila clavata]
MPAVCREDGDCKNGASCQDNVCLCEPGYEGEKCEKMKNCEELKCDTEISDCVLDEKTSTGVCKCKDISKLYYEKQCVACREDGDCKNGASCQDNVCLCEPGYEGEKCEKIKNCEELKCDTEISDCVLDEKTSTGVCKCKDISKLYYEKQCVACREDGDCKNGASCQDNVCLCEPGYEGEKCEKIKNCEELKCDTAISDCVLDEKTSKGMCICKDLSKQYFDNQCVYCDCGPNGKCSIDENGKQQCACSSGFEVVEKDGKKTCKETNSTTTVITDSSSSATSPETTTITKEVSTDSSSSTMTTMDEGKEIDPCTKDPCMNGGTCEKRDNSFACTCVQGYTGDRCDEIKWCKENGKTICGNEKCRFDEKRSSGFCFCRNDSFFDLKEKRCKKMDSCLERRLSGECNMPFETCDAGECKCIVGYDYSTNKTSCEPAFCKKGPCGRNMDCEETDDSYICFCKDSYHQVGKDCVKYDNCSPGQSKCAQRCRSNGKCTCVEGYNTTDGGENCDPVKEVKCSLNCGKGSCSITGKSCVCPEISHVYKNKTCIDKCTAGVLSPRECPAGNKCMPDDTFGYRCDCKGKFKFAPDDVHCELKHMCSEGGAEAICAAKNALCVEDFDNAEGYVCKCEDGYARESGTDVCKNKCELKQKKCLENQALCMLDANNNAICVCPPLLTKGTDGKCNKLATYSYTGDFLVEKKRYDNEERRRTKRSVGDIDYTKLRDDFNVAMNRIFEGYNDSAILNCVDAEEHWKCSMEIKLDKYPGEKIHIITTPTVCLPMSDAAHCLILPNFVIKSSETEVFYKTDPCRKEMTSILCGDATNCNVLKKHTIAFECKCKEGYYPRTTYHPALDASVEICDDVNECMDLLICPNTTFCYNIPGDYNCLCKEGYILDESKSVKKDGCTEVCNPDPCVHGTCIQMGKHGFSCDCLDGLYTGRFCNETNEAVTRAKKVGKRTSSIVGGVLGAFLAILIIVCIFLIRKVRKQSSLDDNEEYSRQRQRGLVSQMRNLAHRVPDREEDVEVRNAGRRPDRQHSESGDYRREPEDSLSIPRPQVGRPSDRTSGGRPLPERRDSGGYQKGFSGDNRMYSRAPRRSDEESRPNQRSEERELPLRSPLSKSSDHLDSDGRNGRMNMVQYRNRGYEEE